MADRSYLSQIGRPTVDKAFDGLRTITRVFEVNAEGSKVANIETEVFLAYGTADAEFTGALLVKRGMQPVSNNKNAFVLHLTEVYQEFTDNTKVSVGEDQIILAVDGRSTFVRSYVCLAEDAESLAAPIGTVLDGRACSNVQINKHGVGAEIVETYISAGQLSQSDSTKYNGALLLRTLTYYNQVPGTPAGYTLTDTQVQNTNGVPTYTYQFAKGVGEISRQTNYSRSVDLGTAGLIFVTIKYLTAPGAGDPTSSPGAGYIKSGVDYSQQDGYMVWTVSYSHGTGSIDVEEIAREDGSIVYEVTTLSAASATPTYPGTGTGYLTRLKNTIDDGYYVNHATYVKLPVTVTIKNEYAFRMPGLASFSGNDLIISPPSERTVLADEEISYDTAQLTDVSYTVSFGSYFRSNYIRTGESVAQSEQRSLGYILSGSSGVHSATPGVFNGMPCDSFDATLNSSSPVSRPSGLTVLRIRNDEYLVDTSGTRIYRRHKYTFTFP
jgi:hypothetical protein